MRDYSNHDLAELADWAAEQEDGVANPLWKDVYRKLKEATDELLRRRAKSTIECGETLSSDDLEQPKETIVEKIRLVPVPYPKPDGGTVTVPYFPPLTIPNTGTPYKFPGSEIICWYPTCSHGNVFVS